MDRFADTPLSGRPVLPVPARVGLWIVAGAILAGWSFLVAIHVSDDYRITHNQGVWLALADAAHDGRLYPPIFDGEHYAGTRHMPVPILLNGWAAGLSTDPLVGVRLLAAGLMATLLTIVVVILRQSFCPWPLATALAATIVATDTGLQAGMSIGGDLLPVVLQVGALAIAMRARGGPGAIVAGVLGGFAIASKLTGVWGLLSVTSWFAAKRQWQHVALFSASCIATASVVLGAVELITHRGLSAHLLSFSVAGVQGGSSFLRGPNQILFNLLGHAWGSVVLIPIAALGALLPRDLRHVSIFHVALTYAFLLLIFVYADVGTGFNQLLDVVVLTVLAVGALAGRTAIAVERRELAVILLLVVVSVIWAGGLDLVRTVGFDVRGALAATSRTGPITRASQRVALLVRPGEEVLAEDPAIYVTLGRQPVVMDPFMLMRLDHAQPELVEPLIARIAARQFDLVVLLVALEDRSLDFWWTDFHFGPRIADVLRSSYRADGTIGRYFLYRPR